MKKMIILDRDGIINYDSDEYIKSPDEWHAIPGSLEAIAQLNRAGFHVMIATNQSGIGRGYYDVEMLDLIHEKMFAELAAVGGHIDEIFFCPHLPSDHCHCRKPEPGLLLQIQQKYDIDLRTVYFIGDKWTDAQAAIAAHCNPLLVLANTKEIVMHSVIVPRFATLMEAVEYVILQSSL